jgi:muramoyltetrapeptide carboxypeptidase
LQGGHGSSRLFEKLVALRPLKEKVFIGFSDVTAIAILFGRLWGWKSVYAPNLVQIVSEKVSEASIKDIERLIFEGETKLGGLVSYNESARQENNSNLVLQGGCLALVQSLIGTDYQPKVDNRMMLLLEDDRFESPQRIDRMLMQIMRSGMLDSVGAVLLGNFLEQPEHEVAEIEKKYLDGVLKEFGLWLDQKKVPLVRHNRVGHAYHMVPLILGKESQLVISGDKIELIN